MFVYEAASSEYTVCFDPISHAQPRSGVPPAVELSERCRSADAQRSPAATSVWRRAARSLPCCAGRQNPAAGDFHDRVLFCFFFFFQAEDGIRDVAVTGVQTCALPI